MCLRDEHEGANGAGLVRTPLAAQTVASTAARLGMTGVVRTAISETEAMIRLAERPAEVVLADTAVFFGVCEFSPEGAASDNREPRIGRLRVRADARRSRRFTDSSESE